MDSADPQRKRTSSPYNAFFAAAYDPLLWQGERAGMADRRSHLLKGAGGRVLELGAGTGLNLERYPDGLDELVLTEPEESMAVRLERRLAEVGMRGEVTRDSAESLPFEDHSFDTVVSTFVLCTVDDPDRSLREIRRVLAPGGRLLFIEHVRSESERLARWQDRLARPWKAFACGCNCNLDTLALMRSADLVCDGVEHIPWRRMPPLVRPLVSGSAEPQPG